MRRADVRAPVQLNAEETNRVLVGGLGADDLLGDAGADTFVVGHAIFGADDALDAARRLRAVIG